MTIAYSDNLRKINKNVLNVGDSPSATQLDRARETVSYFCFSRGFGQLLNVINADNSYSYFGNYASKFYCVFPKVDPDTDDNKTSFALVGQCFENYNGSTVTIKINSTTIKTIDTGGAVVGSGSGVSFFETFTELYNCNSSGNYSVLEIEVIGTVLSSLSLFAAPRNKDDFDSDQTNLKYALEENNFRSGNPLQGIDNNDSSNSFGALVNAFYSDENLVSAISLTKYCLFQYAHPAGIYAAGSGGIYYPIFGRVETTLDNDVKISCRGLTDPITVDVIISARVEAGATLKITSSIDTAYVTLTTATGATPAVNIVSGVEVALEDTLQLEIYSTAGYEIKTVAIFENC